MEMIKVITFISQFETYQPQIKKYLPDDNKLNTCFYKHLKQWDNSMNMSMFYDKDVLLNMLEYAIHELGYF